MPEYGLALTVRTMETALYQLFKDLERELAADPRLAKRVQTNAPRVRETVRPEKSARETWERFLTSVGWKRDAK